MTKWFNTLPKWAQVLIMAILMGLVTYLQARTGVIPQQINPVSLVEVIGPMNMVPSF